MSHSIHDDLQVFSKAKRWMKLFTCIPSPYSRSIGRYEKFSEHVIVKTFSLISGPQLFFILLWFLLIIDFENLTNFNWFNWFKNEVDFDLVWWREKFQLEFPRKRNLIQEIKFISYSLLQQVRVNCCLELIIFFNFNRLWIIIDFPKIDQWNLILKLFINIFKPLIQNDWKKDKTFQLRSLKNETELKLKCLTLSLEFIFLLRSDFQELFQFQRSKCNSYCPLVRWHDSNDSVL